MCPSQFPLQKNLSRMYFYHDMTFYSSRNRPFIFALEIQTVQLGQNPKPKTKSLFWTKANTKLTFKPPTTTHPRKFFSQKGLSKGDESSCVNLLRENKMKDSKK